MWAKYIKDRKEDKNTPDFDKYVSIQIEEIVKELDQVLKTREDQEISVACISFGYKNGEILKALAKRGGYLGLGKFKEA